VDGAGGVAVDASGVYVVGTLGGNVPGKPSPESFVRKYDSAGNVIWSRQMGVLGAQPGALGAAGIAVDASGVYVAGAVFSNVLPATAAVRKYDTSGTQLWTHQLRSLYPAGGMDTARAVDSAGNLYVGGGGYGGVAGPTAFG